jgi:thioredoxin reductase
MEHFGGRVISRSAVFIGPANVPHANGLLAGADGDIDEAGFVIVDATGRTSSPGKRAQHFRVAPAV